MPQFKLPATPRNLIIARFITGTNASLKISTKKDHILVGFNHGLNLQRLFVEKAVPDLTDIDWANIRKHIRNSLVEGKIISESEIGLSIRPLKTRVIRLRVDPVEEHVIREAAKEAGKSLSDYVRGKLLQGAETEDLLRKWFNKQESTIRQQEPEQKRLKESKKTPQRYVT